MAAAGDGRGADPAPQEARDVMAFGHEAGRVLSDGRIVGRAEPFAKVFPSSRVVKRAVGPGAWAVLEDIALDAVLDNRSRLVAETNTRQVATNLGLNKDTVARHLKRLREYGFVLQEESRAVGSGRYEVVRYVLDPSACVERFSHTPTAEQTPASTSPQPSPEGPQGRASGPKQGSAAPRPNFSDAVTAEPVSEKAGHGETGHGVFGQTYRHVDVDQQEHVDGAPASDDQPAGGQEPGPLAGAAEAEAEGDGDPDAGPPRDAAGDAELWHCLRALGVAGHVAEDLLARHAADRVRDVVAAAKAKQLRRPAGWIVSALRDGWDLTHLLAEQRAAEERERQQAEQAAAKRQAAQAEQTERDRAEGWAAAVSAALDDQALSRAIAEVATPVGFVGRRSVPVARAELVRWAAAVHQQAPDQPLAEALTAALAAGATPPPDDQPVELPPPPQASATPAELSARIAACLEQNRSQTAASSASDTPKRQRPDPAAAAPTAVATDASASHTPHHPDPQGKEPQCP